MRAHTVFSPRRRNIVADVLCWLLDSRYNFVFFNQLSMCPKCQFNWRTPFKKWSTSQLTAHTSLPVSIGVLWNPCCASFASSFSTQLGAAEGRLPAETCREPSGGTSTTWGTHQGTEPRSVLPFKHVCSFTASHAVFNKVRAKPDGVRGRRGVKIACGLSLLYVCFVYTLTSIK